MNSERILNIGDEYSPIKPEDNLDKVEDASQETFGNRESKEYKHIQSAFSKATQENAQLRSMVTNLEDKINRLTARLDLPAQAPVKDKPDELNDAAKDFEELKPFVSRIQQIEQQAILENNHRKQTEIDNQNRASINAKKVHNQKIMSVHPDAFPISDTVDFKGWLAQQPGYVQEVINTGSAEDVISLLTSYKSQVTTKMDEFRETTTPNIGNNGTGSVVDTNKEPPKFTPAEIEAMSDAEFIKNEEAINDAMKEGRIY